MIRLQMIRFLAKQGANMIMTGSSARKFLYWVALGSAWLSPALAQAQTTSVFDVVVVTGTLTVAGTTTLQGNMFSVGGSTLVVVQGNVGIGTTTPAALLHLVSGPVQGSGAQFMWIASSAALRAGEVNGSHWNPANIGPHSVAFGLNNSASGAQSFIGSGNGNSAGGSQSVISGGQTNSVTGDFGAILGGKSNSVSTTAVVVGGQNNTALAFGFTGAGNLNSAYANGVVGGGSSNDVTGSWGFIGGGSDNTGGSYSVVAGGIDNTASTALTVIGGGYGNFAYGYEATVLGGESNTAAGMLSAVLGGNDNVTNGDFSVVLGGQSNATTGSYSLAGGRLAKALARGSFVWADSQNSAVTSSIADEFRIRAGGGFVFLSTPTAATTIVSNGAILISTSGTAASAVPNIYVSSVNGRVGIGTALPGATLAINGDIAASSAAFSSTGTAVYSLTSSSGIHVLAGRIKLEQGTFIEWGDNSTSTTAAASSGGGTSGALTWTKYTRTYANFSAGATNSTSTLVTVPAGTVIHGVKIKHSTAFTGSGITAYTISVGTGPGGSASSLYASPYNVFQVATSTAFQLSQNFTAEEASATWSIGASAASTGANLNAASQGSVDIWILTSVTP